MREISVRVGITERAVQQIVRDLTDAGLVRIEKTGRRNHYVVDTGATFRHPLEAHVRIGRFADLVRDGRPPAD